MNICTIVHSIKNAQNGKVILQKILNKPSKNYQQLWPSGEILPNLAPLPTPSAILNFDKHGKEEVN